MLPFTPEMPPGIKVSNSRCCRAEAFSIPLATFRLYIVGYPSPLFEPTSCPPPHQSSECLHLPQTHLPRFDPFTHDQSQMSRTRREADTFMTKIQPKFEGIFNRPTKCNSAFGGGAGEVYQFNPNPAVNMLELNVPEHQGPYAGFHPYTQLSQSALKSTFVQSIHQAEQTRSDGWTMAYHLEKREGLRNGDWAYIMSGTKHNKGTGDKQTYTRAGVEGGQFWGPQRSLFAWELTTETSDGTFTSQHGNGAYEVQLDSPLITVDDRGVPHKEDRYRGAISTSVEEPKVYQKSTGSATKEVDSFASNGTDQDLDLKACEE
jgi:hypothetical protein